MERIKLNSEHITFNKQCVCIGKHQNSYINEYYHITSFKELLTLELPHLVKLKITSELDGNNIGDDNIPIDFHVYKIYITTHRKLNILGYIITKTRHEKDVLVFKYASSKTNTIKAKSAINAIIKYLID